MRVEDIRQVAIVGAGTMGHGIAQEFAKAGYATRLVDRSDELLTRAWAAMRRDLDLMAGAGLVDRADIEPILGRVRTTTVLADAVSDADLVIEAVFEDLALKQDLFHQLDALCPPHAVLASNSSTLMPSQLVPSERRAPQVLVAHYFNPPHLLPLVEVVRGPATSDESAFLVRDLLRSIGKQPVMLSREVPGFIANRLQTALWREALSLVESGVATADDVDTVVRGSFGRRLAFAGPLEVVDLAGLDVISAVMRLLLPDIDSSTAVSPLLADAVARGDLGVKSGRGLYDQPPAAADELRTRMAQGLILLAQHRRP